MVFNTKIVGKSLHKIPLTFKTSFKKKYSFHFKYFVNS